jgi:hypothetical protein
MFVPSTVQNIQFVPLAPDHDISLLLLPLLPPLSKLEACLFTPVLCAVLMLEFVRYCLVE